MKYNFMNLGIKLQIPIISENIAKGTTDPRLECSCQSNFFRSYSEVLHKFWSNFIFRILTKHQPQNLKQTSASKYWPKFSFKICTELTLQYLDQALFSKPEQKFSIKNMTKFQFPNLHQRNFSASAPPSLVSDKDRQWSDSSLIEIYSERDREI